MAIDFGKGLGYAANPAGGLAALFGGESAFRDVDPIGGKLFGFKSDEEKAVEDAFKKMQQEIAAYRPIASEARMGGLSNQLGLFDSGMNPMLESMYGPGGGFDVSGLLQNPLARAQQQADQGKQQEQKRREERFRTVNMPAQQQLVENPSAAISNGSLWRQATGK